MDTTSPGVPPAAAAASTPRLFVRQSSGLVKSLGFTGSLSVTLGAVAISSGSIVLFNFTLSAFPNLNVILMMFLAGLLCAVNAWTYAQVGAATPRAGGDYVMASRVLHPLIAFPASFMQVMFLGLVVGSGIAWISNTGLNNLFRSLGALYGNSTFVSWAAFFGTPEATIAVGTIGMALIFYTLFLSPQVVIRIQILGLALTLIAVLFITLALLTTDTATFKAHWDTLMGAGNYDQVVPAAVKGGQTAAYAGFVLLLAAAYNGYNVYFAFQSSTMYAGEMKQVTKNLVFTQFGALLLAFVAMSLMAIGFYHAIPTQWAAAEAYLANNSVAGAPLAQPFINFYGAVAWPFLPVILIIAAGWLMGVWVNQQAWMFILSRPMFAWAFDRVVPEKIATVGRSGSPWVAALILCVFAEIGLVLSQKSSALVQFNFPMAMAFAQAPVCIAAATYPFRKPEMWRNGPKIVTQRILGIPAMTISGIATLLLMVWLVFDAFSFQQVGGQITFGTFLIPASMVLFALIFILGMRAYRKSTEGIDLFDTFKEIPPV